MPMTAHDDPVDVPVVVPQVRLIDATPSSKAAMYLPSDSAAGVRFLAAVQEVRGVKPSARAAGVGKATGYRWLREAFLALREYGCSVEDAQAELGYFSPLALVWDQ
jgi:hypothetical protein